MDILTWIIAIFGFLFAFVFMGNVVKMVDEKPLPAALNFFFSLCLICCCLRLLGVI